MTSIGSHARPRLLVLGGGQYQVPAINAAHRLGCHVTVIDKSPHVPGARIADRFESIDTTDHERACAFAIQQRIEGVIAPCSDVAVPTQAYVAEAIGGIGPSLAAAEILTDKSLFRSYQAKRGLPHPETWTFSAISNPIPQLPPGHYVIKPTRSSGSKGIFVCEHHEIASRLPETLVYCVDGRVLIESLIAGVQGTVEGIWRDNRVSLAVITDRLTAKAPLVVTCGHLWPSRLDLASQQQVLSAIADTLTDLKIPNTVFDCDFVMGPKDPFILELTPRLGGNGLTNLVRLATGRDLPLEAVGLAFPNAKTAQYANQKNKIANAVGVLVLGSSKAGNLCFDRSGEQYLRQQSWLNQISWDFEYGSSVRAFENGRDRIGEVLFTAKSRDILDDHQNTINNKLSIIST